jgi:hypothetical protein
MILTESLTVHKGTPLKDVIKKAPQLVATSARQTFARPMGKTALLNAARKYPQRRAVHPFVWSFDPTKNARARRRYFAMIRAGEVPTDGYGYKRTGALAAGYDASIVTTNADVVITLQNKADRKRHLYTKGRRQVPGHVTTGWQKDDTIFAAWYRRFAVQFAKDLSGNLKRAKVR